MISQERLKEIMDYDPESGMFTWKITRRNKVVSPGMNAGSLRKDGYIRLRLDMKSYLAHRIAWLFVYGELPEKQIDHINGVKSDNRICNLRKVTIEENQHNKFRENRNSTTGFLGVSFHRTDKKYLASIGLNGKKINLGRFDDPKSAHEAYLTAKRKLHTSAPLPPAPEKE